MANNYMTEQYMTSILQQYQQNSPQKTSPQNVSQNFNQFYENEEQNRRQLNESLFKSIDDSFERQSTQISADNTRSTDTPIRVQQMVRNPVITSDSFRPPKPVIQQNRRPNFEPMRNGNMRARQSVRSQYFGQSVPQTRVRAQTYKAKVIDYSNGIIEKPKMAANAMVQNLRPVPVPPSVLTERNPLLKPIRFHKSTEVLHSTIPSNQKPITQRSVPQRPVIKPILKNCAQNQLKPALSGLAANNCGGSQKLFAKPKGIPAVSPKPTPERDTSLEGFENDGIIRTVDLDKNEIFYCYFCNTYLKKVVKVEKHCKLDFHKTNICKTIENSLSNPLNKRFILDQITPNETLESIGLTAETVIRIELDRILPENKHFYYMKGIRLKNPGGPDVYYCRFCEQSIQCLGNIESHIFTESHGQKELRTSFSDFLSQTTEPIIGLQYIIEYMSHDLLQPLYECSLCQSLEEAYNMYLHVCSFRHRLNLLKKYNPNEAILDTIKESPHAIKEIRKRIKDLSETVPIGAIIKQRNGPNWKKLQEQKGKNSDVEVIDITDDDDKSSNLNNICAISVSTDEEAADTALLIQALKESVVKYYLSKIPAQMRRVLINKVMDNEEVMDLDINF